VNEQQQAAQALAMVEAHQEETRRRARPPWWFYLGLFVLVAGLTAANDFVSLGGAKLIAVLVLAALAAALIARYATRTAPLSRLRGVQQRRSVEPRTFGIVVVVGVVGGWLIAHYGDALVDAIGGAVGLRNYPNTVTGVLYAILFTALFALVQALTEGSARRAGR
jgi:hypothetical protein